jgi:hypothetical protein
MGIVKSFQIDGKESRKAKDLGIMKNGICDGRRMLTFGATLVLHDLKSSPCTHARQTRHLGYACSDRTSRKSSSIQFLFNNARPVI